jgi:hypothetical protein
MYVRSTEPAGKSDHDDDDDVDGDDDADVLVDVVVAVVVAEDDDDDDNDDDNDGVIAYSTTASTPDNKQLPSSSAQRGHSGSF